MTEGEEVEEDGIEDNCSHGRHCVDTDADCNADDHDKSHGPTCCDCGQRV